MKKTLILGFMILGLFATSVQAVDLTGILKTNVNRYEAEKICKDNGMRLPTARELAEVSQSFGAEGISETPKEGYYLVNGSDSTGQPDRFYFSYKGYQRPSGDFGSYWFWSSSVTDSYLAYKLNGFNGDLDYFIPGYDLHAVRCVRLR